MNMIDILTMPRNELSNMSDNIDAIFRCGYRFKGSELHRKPPDIVKRVLNEKRLYRLYQYHKGRWYSPASRRQKKVVRTEYSAAGFNISNLECFEREKIRRLMRG